MSSSRGRAQLVDASLTPHRRACATFVELTVRCPSWDRGDRADVRLHPHYVHKQSVRYSTLSRRSAGEHAVVGWTRADEERGRADNERGRADRERDRADAERDKAEAVAAKLLVLQANGAEQIANFERNMADLRALVDGLQRPWWKRLARG